jgi:hypothetical protein
MIHLFVIIKSKVAAQQGGQLLQQALQQGAQLAANGAQSKIIYIL